MRVSHYGIHDASGIKFLHQDIGICNLISPELKSPYYVHVVPKTLRCPHAIDIDRVLPAPDWINDPLAQAVLPTPGASICAVPSVDDKLIRQLCRLSSPVDQLMVPIWFNKPSGLIRRYELTNLSPIILTGVSMGDIRSAMQHIEFAQLYRRRLLLICEGRLPIFTDVSWVKTELTDLSDEPLEAIGAGLIREVMQQ